MSLLLDTHALLWWLSAAPMEEAAATKIADSGVLVAVSAATVWEIGIKRGLGKLRFNGSMVEQIEQGGFEPLPISMEHADAAGSLPPHHRDPFDRMLIAQAMVENLTLVTRDTAFDDYEVDLLRC